MRFMRYSAAALAVAAGCSPNRREAVTPTEAVTATSSTGAPAAVYDVTGPSGEKLGEAKVSSLGAYRATVNGVKQTVIQVGFDLENGSDSSLVFDPMGTSLTSVNLGHGRSVRNLPVATTHGMFMVPPRTAREVDVYFVLPQGVHPQSVDGFSLAWTVNAAGKSYTHFTPFVQQDEYYAYVPDYHYGYYGYYGAFYDPFYYHAYSWPNYYAPYRYDVIEPPRGHVRDKDRALLTTPRRTY